MNGQTSYSDINRIIGYLPGKIFMINLMLKWISLSVFFYCLFCWNTLGQDSISLKKNILLPFKQAIVCIMCRTK